MKKVYLHISVIVLISCIAWAYPHITHSFDAWKNPVPVQIVSSMNMTMVVDDPHLSGTIVVTTSPTTIIPTRIQTNCVAHSRLLTHQIQ